MDKISLEPAVRILCSDERRRFIPTTIGIRALRKRLQMQQEGPVYQHPASFTTKKVVVPGRTEPLNIHFVYPRQPATAQLPVLFYIHGGQFITGDLQVYNKFIRELAVRAQVMVVFPEYSLAPEAQAPDQIKQLQHALAALPQFGEEFNLDLERVIIGADDVGAKFAAQLIADPGIKEVAIYKMAWLCPVTNYNFDTASYYEFAGGYDLTREQMKFAWHQYLGRLTEQPPLQEMPLRYSSELLATFPETLIITAEADVVRDEGEAMARKMRDAGVSVAQIRMQGTIHNFVIYNELDITSSCRLAMNVLVDWIKKRG